MEAKSRVTKAKGGAPIVHLGDTSVANQGRDEKAQSLIPKHRPSST